MHGVRVIETYNEKKGFIHNYIHSLLYDKNGRLWIGTGNGIAYLQNRKLKILDNSQLCNSYVGCISEDRFGNIWFSTDRCLMRYDGLKYEKYDRLNGLVSNTLYLVKCDSKDNVWVGSNAGVNRLKLGPYGKIEKIDHFSMIDGFIGNECNSRGVYESPKGDLYFCTIRGLIKYIGKEEFKTVCNHKVIINGLSIFYSTPVFSEIEHGPVKSSTSLYLDPVFSHYQNHLTFQFICTEKCRPNDVSYSFKLENFDKSWSPPVKTNIATYSNLPAGTYTFMVKTLDKNKEPTGITDTYSFTITAPFWLKPWFYITIAILFFGFLAFLKFRSEQRDEFHRLLLEKKVNQRTIELTKQKEERELLLKEIHHRVKN
ncbi:MAG TPA: two-component regulator propeller domain-containing protein, partial [Flavobacteriales bacterium]|nr:two-component regulator propeller domain-containing protein [Flavobacteriales bacterium]